MQYIYIYELEFDMLYLHNGIYSDCIERPESQPEFDSVRDVAPVLLDRDLRVAILEFGLISVQWLGI